MNSENNINLQSDYVILDVDRTIINTTSWYQACICPNLLITEDRIDEFIHLNNKTFRNKNEETFKEFRNKTLKMISNTISKKSLEKIKSLDFHIYFKEGESINNFYFYLAGLYTSYNNVKIYKDAIEFIKFASRYYGDNLKLIFLTSGYESFINGVIDGIIKQCSITNINYSVIGSKLEIVKGIPSESFFMSQFEKESFVKKMIKFGCKVRFLADDSTENLKLFKIVNDAGGSTLRVKHETNQTANKSWKEFNNLYSNSILKDYLKKEDSYCSINKNSIILPDMLQIISDNINTIGIVSVKEDDYQKNIDAFVSHFQSNENKHKFKKIMNELIFIKGDKVFLRGKNYYNWLPPYIFINYQTLNESWQNLMNKSILLLEILVQERVFNNINVLTKTQKLLIYAVIDHLLEGIFYILNIIERNQLCLKTKEIYNINGNKKAYNLAQEISDLLYFYIEDKNCESLAKKILKATETLSILKEIPKFTPNYKYMREMDNNVSIYMFVKSIFEKIKNKKTQIDYVINFAYGGIAIGFAFKSYLKIMQEDDTKTVIVNCHYSSKQKLREQKKENEQDFVIYDYVPVYYNKNIKDIMKGENNILLLDNNVTTFKTLDFSKKFLEKYGNKVYCGVVAINYDNIYKYLLQDKEFEELTLNWHQILDFNPIEEYITSFNTWKTSEKTNMLEEIYYLKDNIVQLDNNISEYTINDHIFKLCRVHNIYDLQIALQNGVNMIGIHAVYPNRIKYLCNEIKYNPIKCDFNFSDKIPIALLEIDSIREMEKYVPKNIKQAILFEKPEEVEIMQQCCDIYGMSKENVIIQLQHRTNLNHIKEIKNKISQSVIITIGAFQKDFYEYFWDMNKVLDYKTDYILIDLSKHQPDILSGKGTYSNNFDKVIKIKQLCKLINNSRIPIILADDTTTEQMKKYIYEISSYNINFVGIDMQNNVEIKQSEQKYQLFKNHQTIYQGKIRKSKTLLAEWSNFFDKGNKNLE